MSHQPLDQVRVGCVAYLNARPLLYGCTSPVVLDHPSILATSLANAELDVALVPVFDLFAHPGYRIADGVSISSRGPVFSVFLAYRGELRDVREISLDPASHTSAHVLRILLAEFYDFHPDYTTQDAEARLLIGNQAIEFRHRHGDEYRYFDLGEEWQRETGLPFVYALWLIRPEVAEAATVAAALREIRRAGEQHIDEIVVAESEGDAAFRRRYLTTHIRYDLGDQEKRGLALFGQLLAKHRYIPAEITSFDFV